jgi:hypothetical protein
MNLMAITFFSPDSDLQSGLRPDRRGAPDWDNGHVVHLAGLSFF